MRSGEFVFFALSSASAQTSHSIWLTKWSIKPLTPICNYSRMIIQIQEKNSLLMHSQSWQTNWQRKPKPANSAPPNSNWHLSLLASRHAYDFRAPGFVCLALCYYRCHRDALLPTCSQGHVQMLWRSIFQYQPESNWRQDIHHLWIINRWILPHWYKWELRDPRQHIPFQ